MSADNYWLNLAEYDMETAKAMLKAKRYLYVGFMCHQTIEKALKALFSKQHNEVPPRIHNLARLVRLVHLDKEMPEDFLELIHKLNPLNITSRYPDEELDILKDLTVEYMEEILIETRRLFHWLKTKI